MLSWVWDQVRNDVLFWVYYLTCANVWFRYMQTGRANVCPMMSYGAGGAQNRPSPCRTDNDCSNSKVCCKTNRGGKECVDPPPKMPDGRLKL